MAAVYESLPDNFANSMEIFGQRLIDKAKSMLAPKNRWLFDSSSFEYIIKDGKSYKKTIKNGKILLAEDSIEFMDDSNSGNRYSIEDYDELHWLKTDKNWVVLRGRKIATSKKDDKQIQDPMEAT